MKNRSLDDPAYLYLDLLKRTLTRAVFEENDEIPGQWTRPWITPTRLERIAAHVQAVLNRANMELVRRRPYDLTAREFGDDWPARAETMIGLRRLDNIQHCIETVISEGIPGDLIETGVWRGGAVIFMRGVLKAFGDHQRTVWVADSFRGLPKPNVSKYPSDASSTLYKLDRLAVSEAEVRHNFERYGLLDEQVRFLVGWFHETLPQAPMDHLSVCRLDGDMYQSTMDSLKTLYPKLSEGGFCIVDDYLDHPGCRQAVTDYRNVHDISDQIINIDERAVFWRRSGTAPVHCSA